MIIYIEGTVGSGKSTLAERIGNTLNIPIEYELQNETTNYLLEDFYKDKKRWSFTLQCHFLIERAKMCNKVQKNGIGILDRSLFGDKIFASMLHEDGFMNKNEYNTYISLLNNLYYTNKPDLLIYINCDLETAVERINKRGREMEQTVDIDYWNRLNNKYTLWYDYYNASKKLSIGAKSYHPDNETDIKNICNKIKSYFQLK